MLPNIPIQMNIYPGLLFLDQYVHVLKNETVAGTLLMTEDLFLQLCSICSAEDLARYQQAHLEQRFILVKSGLIAKEEYFEQAWEEIALIKAIDELLEKHNASFRKSTSEYDRELAAYINNHSCLQKILGFDIMGAADLYMDLIRNPDHYQLDDDFATERYSSAAGLQQSLFRIFDTLNGKLKQDYLSIEPCVTLVAAMWRYGYFRYQQGTIFKRCEKAGCKNYFAYGPGGQTSRRYCKAHTS